MASTTASTRSSVVYSPGKDQQFVWDIMDKVADVTKVVTDPVANVVSTGANAVTSSANAVGGAVGGAVSSVHFPTSHGNSRTQISKLSKDQVSDWLTANGLHIYRLGFQSNEVDGHSLLALLALWRSDKPGFIKFTQESLGVKAPGHALRLASVLEEIFTYKFEDN